MNLRHVDSRPGQFFRGHDAVGPWSPHDLIHECLFALEELQLFFHQSVLFHDFGDFPGGYRSRIGDIVFTVRQIHLKRLQAGVDEFEALGNGIFGIQQPFIVQQFAQVIPGIIALVKGNPQAPDIALFCTIQHFLAERLGSTVKAAVVRPK